MNRYTRPRFSKLWLSSVLLTAIVLTQFGQDGQATVHHNQQSTYQTMPWAAPLTAPMVSSTHLLHDPSLSPTPTRDHNLESTKKYQRLESIKDKKQLGLTLFFLGIVGEKT